MLGGVMQLQHIRWAGTKPPKQDDAKRLLEAEGFEVVCWSDAPGRNYAPHSHERDESLWMIAGAMTFVIDGRAYRVEAGDRLTLPRGVVHDAQAHEAGARYLIGER
jgi:quercetin dioxygenase-like cupin family protein